MWSGSDPRTRETERRGELYSAAGHAGCAFLPPAGRRPPKTLRPCPGIRYFANLPAAYRSSGRGQARERRETRGADQCPGKEQSENFLAPQF